jgi:hypothetical protein
VFGDIIEDITLERMPGSPRLTRTGAGKSKDNKGRFQTEMPQRALSDPGSPASGGPCEISSETISSIVDRTVSVFLTDERLLNKLVEKLTNNISAAVIENLNAAMVDANRKIDDLNKEITFLKDELSKRKVEFEAGLDAAEQYSRRNNIRIYGLPEDPRENTDGMVVSLFKDKLNITIDASDIDRSHRVGRQLTGDSLRGGRSRPVLVKFSRYRIREKIYANKKLLKNTGIVIREDLTAHRLELYHSAVGKFGIHRVWTVDGRIFWIGPDGRRRVGFDSVRDLALDSS